MSLKAASLVRVNRRLYVRNLLNLYRSADERDVIAGLRWYPNATDIVCEWAHEYTRPVANVAAVVSALSPQCHWDRNLIVAGDLLAGRAPSVWGPLLANLEKARTLLETGSHDISSVFKCAPKVASFACNLAGCYDVVTVDTHAAQALRDDVLSTDRLTLPLYAEMASIYREAAERAGIQPAFFQAIVWLAWKRRYPTREKIARRSAY